MSRRRGGDRPRRGFRPLDGVLANSLLSAATGEMQEDHAGDEHDLPTAEYGAPEWAAPPDRRVFSEELTEVSVIKRHAAPTMVPKGAVPEPPIISVGHRARRAGVGGGLSLDYRGGGKSKYTRS